MLRPPSPFTKYGKPLKLIRSYWWSCPASTPVAPHCWYGHCSAGVLPCTDPDEYGGWCMYTSFQGSVEAASRPCSHTACDEPAVFPSGSLPSLSIEYRCTGPDVKS